MAWSKLIDMEMDDEDSLDAPQPFPMADRPRYPYGLRICLCDSELAKLNLDADCNVGDMIDLRCFAVVTSVSKNETAGGSQSRVELQITRMAVEDELTESEND
jgi:hypothetical protein